MPSLFRAFESGVKLIFAVVSGVLLIATSIFMIGLLLLLGAQIYKKQMYVILGIIVSLNQTLAGKNDTIRTTHAIA